VPRPTARAGKEKCVIIDPGHGGANQGAKSATTINGKQVFEKDLVFQFAYHLKKVIDNSPNMIAFLTRSDDSLVALGDRVSFAEKHQGDIFVSLHLNDGAGNPNARGVEIFYLSEKGTVDGAAKAVEERENTDIGASSAASKGSTPLVKRILTDLERGKLEEWQYESYLACKRIIETFQQLPFFRNNNRGVKNANFLVLKNFYMPSVLLEIGFITNSQDLQYLVNPQFQRQTATLLYNALNDIFAENDPSFKAHHLKLTGGSGR
jgi:N-acetylmuramoyl-L-alanine amidase